MEDRGLRYLSPTALLRLAHASRGSETPHFGFRLSASQIVQRAIGLFGRAKLTAEISPYLGHAQHRFGRNVPVVGQQRGKDVDRAGTLIDGLPGFAVGFHAAEHIFHPRIGWIIIDLIGACGDRRGRRSGQHGETKTHPSRNGHRGFLPDAVRTMLYSEKISGDHMLRVSTAVIAVLLFTSELM